MAKPCYWERAARELAAADPVMAGIIEQHPQVNLASRGDAFGTLARSIVGQQISVKAADSIWARVVKSCPELTPDKLRRKRVTTLRACGLSERKVAYLRDLCDHFITGRVDPSRFAELDDEAIIAELVDIHGIGRWTAEMFLIFNLLRPDVLPLDDLGLLKAVGLNYFEGESSANLLRGGGRRRVVALAAAWAPWRSVATWYLWRSLDPVPVEY
ncbi:MAG: DNA-3-methyladenine glycosylase 2 family protein [Burkholderiaceae bacterium]